ncbi:MAG: lysostaphin resistance A-like protein [Roseburia sp.]
MENQAFLPIKRHFSNLGLIYFLGSLIIFGVQIGSARLIGFLNPTLLWHYDSAILVSMLPMYVIALPIMTLLIRTIPSSPLEKHKMSVLQWIIALLMCFALMSVSNMIGQFITNIIALLKGSVVDNVVLQVTSNISLPTSFLLMVILAPIWEEIIFRKLLIDRTAIYGEGVSILLSGLLFGLFHGNLNQFAYAFSLGAFWGFLYVKTGKIIYSILLHMAVNFQGSVISMLVLKSLNLETLYAIMENPSLDNSALLPYLPGLVVCLFYMLVFFAIVIAGIVLLLVNIKKFTLKSGNIVIPKGKIFSTVLLNIGMILFSGFWIVQMILQLLN